MEEYIGRSMEPRNAAKITPRNRSHTRDLLRQRQKRDTEGVRDRARGQAVMAVTF